MKLFNRLNDFKNLIGITSKDQNISYKEILNKISIFKNIIDKNSLLILISSNKIMSILFYIFAIKNNHQIIILDENHTTKFIKKSIKNFKPNYIFYPRSKKIFFKKKNLLISDYCLCMLKKEVDDKINKKNTLILTTSGTTSNPKFVRISQENIFENTYQIQKYLKINKTHKTITTLPMAYSYGLSVINTHLEFGGRIYLNDISPVNINFWETIKNNKINSFSTVPQICEFLKKIKFHKLLTNNLKYLTVAGGKTSKQTLEYMRNVCKLKKIDFFVMYGQTEASPRMTYINLTKINKINSIGKPLYGGKIKIVNNEILYFGKNVSLGYATNIKDLYKGDENKGKLYTGDLGTKDTKGFIYITGRKKRISKLFGLRINLDDIEANLKKEGYKVKLNINDEKLDIVYYRKYSEEKIKKYVNLNYNINKNYISCEYKKQKTKNIFK